MSRGANLKNVLSVLIFLSAFIISLENFGGLLSWILSVAFLVGFLYGVVVLSKKAKFIF